MIMDAERLTADEYEEQYFDFSSTQFYNDLTELVSDHLKETFKEMENLFLDCSVDDNEKKSIKDEMITLNEQFQQKSNELLKDFEPDIREFFQIPKNVLLEEDHCQKYQMTEEEFLKHGKEVIKLEKELEQLKMFEHLCNVELEDLKQLEPVGELLDNVSVEIKKMKNNKIPIERLAKVDAAHDEYLKCFQENMTNAQKLHIHASKFIKKN